MTATTAKMTNEIGTPQTVSLETRIRASGNPESVRPRVK